MSASLAEYDFAEENAGSLAEKLNGGKVMPFGIKDKIGYALGDFGTTMMMGVLASFQSIFYTNVLGIDPALVGVILTFTTIVGAFTDVTAGRLVDKSKLGKKGRFHPWVHVMKWPLAITILMCMCPFVAGIPMGGRVAYLFAAAFCYAAMLSAYNMPYGSMAATLSADPDDRTTLSVFRNIGSAFGAGGVGFVLPLIVYTTDAQGNKVLQGNTLFICTIVCCVIAMVLMELMYRLTTERVIVDKQDNVPVKDLLHSLFHNRALLTFLLAEVVIVCATSIISFMTSYMYTSVFNNTQALSIALLFNYATTLLLAPVARKATKRFGKKEAVSTMLLCAAAIYLVIYFLHLSNPWVYLLLTFLATLCFSAFNVMVWAFMGDVVDYHQYISGQREDGTVFSVNMFGRKVAQSLMGIVTGTLLAAVGYKATTSGNTVQSQQVLDGLYMSATLLPGILLALGALILIFLYPLGKKKTDEISATLKEVNKVTVS